MRESVKDLTTKLKHKRASLQQVMRSAAIHDWEMRWKEQRMAELKYEIQKIKEVLVPAKPF